MAKNKILIKCASNIKDEKVAAAAITPGHLIERTSTDKVQVHATAGGAAQKMFALENDYEGKGIADAYNTTDNSLVQCLLCQPGDRVYAIFDATSGGSLAIGDFVESAGDGTVRKYTPPASSGAVLEQSGNIVGVATEAQTTPGERVIIEIF